MSRNKENKPLPYNSRAVGSVFIGKQPTPPSAEFYTDSLIDENTSRIPTPKHGRNRLSVGQTRRALTSPSIPLEFRRDPGKSARPSASMQNAEKNGIKHRQPAPVLQRPLSMRSSHSDLITPPQSRDGPDALRSPTSVVSNPPQDLADTYQQIYDESVLAETERDSSSGGEEQDIGYRNDAGSPSRPPQRNLSRDAVTYPPARQNDANKENAQDEHTGALSEGSGISFLNQLTDRNLAASATPIMSSHLKDIRRLQKGISDRPITFHVGMKPSEFIADDARSNASSDRSSRSSRRRGLRVGSPVVNGIPKAFSDTNVDVGPRSSPSHTAQKAASPQLARSSLSRPKREPLRELEPDTVDLEQVYQTRAQDSDDDGDLTSPELRQRERRFEQYRAKKFFGIGQTAQPKADAQRDELSDPAYHQQQADNNTVLDSADEDYTMDSLQSRQTEETGQSQQKLAQSNVPVTNKGILRKWQQSAAEQREEKAQSVISDAPLSAVDWVGIDADAPLPSIEGGQDEDNDEITDALSPKPRSASDRLRRHDNETTRMSFQVSESPPVRQRKSIDDLAREREIDQLSRQAVTKSRLEAIREKSPWEAHKRLSRSPSGSSLQKSISSDTTKQADIGEQIPDTPIVVFRSSNGSSKDQPRTDGDDDKQSSHDALQRFARLSATPKSSPSITPKFQPAAPVDAPKITGIAPGVKATLPTIAATPKVSGAWTDTVLPPDTIATSKPLQPRYAQTPQITAGGWFDTPAIPGTQQPTIPESIDEETEEEAENHTAELAGPQSQPTNVARPIVGQSALSNILAAQRARDSGANDTLNFGETTIASLEDFVDLNEEVTSMIRLSAESEAFRRSFDDLSAISHELAAPGPSTNGRENEVVFIEYLNSKITNLQANIRLARKAASRFEREMSDGIANADGLQDESQTIPPTATTAAEPTPPTILNPSGYLPLAMTPLRVPLPLLFHPAPPSTTTSIKLSARPSKVTSTTLLTRTKTRLLKRRRPTPLLYLLLALFCYRFVEILLSELYAHPLYAESYSWPGVAIGSQQGRASNGPALQAESGNVIPGLLGAWLWGEHGGDGAAAASGQVAKEPAGGWSSWVDGVKEGVSGWFIDWDPETTGSALKQEANLRDPVVQPQGVGEEGWSMLDDEVL